MYKYNIPRPVTLLVFASNPIERIIVNWNTMSQFKVNHFLS